MPTKTLYILLPLIIIVLFVVFVFYNLTNGAAINTMPQFSNLDPIQNNNRITKYNAFKPLTEQGGQRARPLDGSALPDWQQSTNIKRATSSAPTTEPNSAVEVGQDALPTADSALPIELPEPEPTFFSDLLAWLPTGSSNTTKSIEQKTPLELEIYEYGNSVGKIIKDFGNSVGNQNQFMSNFVQDMSSTTNIQALEQLAEEYKALAANIAVVQAPTPLSKAANSLSAEYANVGDATLSLSKQRTNEELLQEIYKYNAVVESFATSFIKFSKMFRLYGISYTKGEPGDILMPPVY